MRRHVGPVAPTFTASNRSEALGHDLHLRWPRLLSNVGLPRGEFLVSEQLRDRRYPFRGRIHLLLSHDPWRVRLPLTGLDLGTSGVGALMPQSSPTMLAACDLLFEGASYELQLDSVDADQDGLPPPPPVRAQLVRRVKTAAGLELNFTFETMDALLLAFIEDHGTPPGHGS